MRFPIGVSVVNDRARVTLDMSGEALNRRGYRHLERRGSPAGNAGRPPWWTSALAARHASLRSLLRHGHAAH